MPVYKLKCSSKKCDHVLDNHKCLMDERNKIKCPKCGALMKTMPVLFNGYVLDERFNGIKD